MIRLKSRTSTARPTAVNHLPVLLQAMQTSLHSQPGFPAVRQAPACQRSSTGSSRSSADCALLLSFAFRQIDAQSHRVADMEFCRCHPPADSPRLIILAQAEIQNRGQCLSSFFLRVSRPAPGRISRIPVNLLTLNCVSIHSRLEIASDARSDAASLRRSCKVSLSCLFYSHSSTVIVQKQMPG